MRGETLLIAHHDLVIEPGDHVILFVMDKRQLSKVNMLFQVEVPACEFACKPCCAFWAQSSRHRR